MPSADVRVKLVMALARASGLGGMVGGQILDLAAEGRFPDAPKPKSARRRRDAAGDEDRRADPLRRDGGRDPRRGERGARRARSNATAPRSARRSRSPTTCSTSRATPRRVGKQTGKDAAAGKATIVGVLGIAKSKERLKSLVEEASSALGLFGDRADVLKMAARFVAERQA